MGYGEALERQLAREAAGQLVGVCCKYGGIDCSPTELLQSLAIRALGQVPEENVLLLVRQVHCSLPQLLRKTLFVRRVLWESAWSVLAVPQEKREVLSFHLLSESVMQEALSRHKKKNNLSREKAGRSGTEMEVCEYNDNEGEEGAPSTTVVRRPGVASAELQKSNSEKGVPPTINTESKRTTTVDTVLTVEATADSSREEQEEEALMVVNRIRQEEFGVGQSSDALSGAHARLGRALQRLSEELYATQSHFVLELLQNADDNAYSAGVVPAVQFVIDKNEVLIHNNEVGFLPEHMRALCDVGRSTKEQTEETIGCKGIGFKSVFKVSDTPEVHSRGYHVYFDTQDGPLGHVLPRWLPPSNTSSSSYLLPPPTWQTSFRLPLRRSITGVSVLSHARESVTPVMLLFLHKLQKIEVIDRVKKADGFILQRLCERKVGAAVLVQVSRGSELLSFLKITGPAVAHSLLPLTIVLSLRARPSALGSGEVASIIPNAHGTPVYAYLPIRRYGFKFPLQGPFRLTSSREAIDEEDPVNQSLRDAFPAALVAAARAVRQICESKLSLEIGKDQSVVAVEPASLVSDFIGVIPLPGELVDFFAGIWTALRATVQNEEILISQADVFVRPVESLYVQDATLRALLPYAFSSHIIGSNLGRHVLHSDLRLSEAFRWSYGVQDVDWEHLAALLPLEAHYRMQREGGANLTCAHLHMLVSWCGATLRCLLSLVRHSPAKASDHIPRIRSIPFIIAEGPEKCTCEWKQTPHRRLVITSCAEKRLYLAPEAADARRSRLTETCGVIDCSILLEQYPLPSLPGTSTASVESVDSGEEVRMMLVRLGVQTYSTHILLHDFILPFLTQSAESNDVPEAQILEAHSVAAWHYVHCSECAPTRAALAKAMKGKALILTEEGAVSMQQRSVFYSERYGPQCMRHKKLFESVPACSTIQWSRLSSGYLKDISLSATDWFEWFSAIGVKILLDFNAEQGNKSLLPPRILT